MLQDKGRKMTQGHPWPIFPEHRWGIQTREKVCFRATADRILLGFARTAQNFSSSGPTSISSHLRGKMMNCCCKP